MSSGEQQTDRDDWQIGDMSEVKKYRKTIGPAWGGLDIGRFDLAIADQVGNDGVTCATSIGHTFVGARGTFERAWRRIGELADEFNGVIQGNGKHGPEGDVHVQKEDPLDTGSIEVFREKFGPHVPGVDVVHVELAVPDEVGSSPGCGQPIQLRVVSGPRGTIERLAAALDRFLAEFAGSELRGPTVEPESGITGGLSRARHAKPRMFRILFGEGDREEPDSTFTDRREFEVLIPAWDDILPELQGAITRVESEFAERYARDVQRLKWTDEADESEATARVGEQGGSKPAVHPRVGFDVYIEEVGDRLLEVVKLIRQFDAALSLKEVKDLADCVPGLVVQGISKKSAEEFKRLLEKAGAVASIAPLYGASLAAATAASTKARKKKRVKVKNAK